MTNPKIGPYGIRTYGVNVKHGLSAAAGLPAHIIARQACRAVERLRAAGFETETLEQKWRGGPGTALGITLATEPAPTFFFGLGALGKPAEKVADEAVDQALNYLKAAPAAVDPHSADQLVLPLAFAEGPSVFTVSEVTSHLLTNVAVIRHFLEREIIVEGEEGSAGLVRVMANTPST